MASTEKSERPQLSRDFVLDAVREAAQRQVEENVYQRIRGDFLRLKFLGAGGAVLLFITLYFHQSIFSFIVSIGGESFKKDIGDQIKSEQAILAEARVVRDIIQTQINQSLSAMATRQAELSRLEAQLSKQTTEFGKQKTELEQEMAKLDVALKSINDAKKVIDERVATAQSTAQDAARQISESAEQVNALARTQAAMLSDLKRRSLVEQTIETPGVLDRSRPFANQRPTVYFQFAGFRRDVATEISKKIMERGWSIPGIERTAAAANTNQIRFNSRDQNYAEQLKDDVLQATSIPLALEQNADVKPGIIEIWIYLP